MVVPPRNALLNLFTTANALAAYDVVRLGMHYSTHLGPNPPSVDVNPLLAATTENLPYGSNLLNSRAARPSAVPAPHSGLERKPTNMTQRATRLLTPQGKPDDAAIRAYRWSAESPKTATRPSPATADRAYNEHRRFRGATGLCPRPVSVASNSKLHCQSSKSAWFSRHDLKQKAVIVSPGTGRLGPREAQQFHVHRRASSRL